MKVAVASMAMAARSGAAASLWSMPPSFRPSRVVSPIF